MRCLSCGKDNTPEAEFCANCGAALGKAAEQPSSAASVRCNSCGQDNPPEAAFCSNCGTTLVVTSAPPSAGVSTRPFPISLKWFLVGGLAIIIMFQIVYSFMLLIKPSPPPPTPTPGPAPVPVLVPPPAEQVVPSEVYVNINYEGVGNGTRESPFTTIQEGIERNSGIVRVAAGVYYESINLEDYIILLGSGPHKTVIHGNVFAQNVTGAKICGFTITDNNTAGIHCYFSSVTIANNIIVNQPDCGIGGHDDSLAIINNLIAGNGASGIGLGENCNLTIKNNILLNNDCGVQYGSGTSCIMDYNLMWNNLHGDYGDGVLPGPNDIYADPVFVDAAGDNFQLQPDSPCIDAGDPDPHYNDEDGSRNDIGAFGGSVTTLPIGEATPIAIAPQTVTREVVLISPEEGDVLDNGRTDRLDYIVWDFDWYNCEGATEYHLYVIGSIAEYPVIDIDNITGSSYHHFRRGSYIVGRNSFGWTWKVRAKIDGEWTEWSETRTFDVEPIDTDPPN